MAIFLLLWSLLASHPLLARTAGAETLPHTPYMKRVKRLRSVTNEARNRRSRRSGATNRREHTHRARTLCAKFFQVLFDPRKERLEHLLFELM